jgi:hypothetical protein
MKEVERKDNSGSAGDGTLEAMMQESWGKLRTCWEEAVDIHPAHA